MEAHETCHMMHLKFNFRSEPNHSDAVTGLLAGHARM